MSTNDKPALSPDPLRLPSQDWVAQLRQVSVPVWARAFALILSLAILLPGVALIWGGWLGCVEFMREWMGSAITCHDKWIGQGVEIIVAAFVPAVVILYLVFAETGMRALVRRTNELLEKTLPQALKTLTSVYADGLSSCVVAENVRSPNSISAHYRLQYQLEGKDGSLRLTVSVNVDKAVVVFFLPLPVDADAEKTRLLMAPTIKGAEHEGYVFDEKLVETVREGQQFIQLIARRTLSSDFLWNPSAKMHFAWDLRAFAYSVIHDGHALFQS